jgi:twitching motility two-component system response regulator PilH
MIDDDADFGGLASAHFTKLGYTMTLAHNGKEGLAKAGSLKPDLILLDIMMPDMNGIEVLRELRAAEETSDIPVLVISGKFFDKEISDLFTQEKNFRDFISKPVDFAHLREKVEALLGPKGR